MGNTNLIGISGRAGSGKDTVGSIIQYLTSECGNSNSSRYRSYEEFLSKGGGSAPRNFDHHYQSDWEVKKFAGKLKTIASLLSGANIEDFEDQEFKKGRMTADWGMTYREFLQKLGTEAMRDGLHENVWVNALFADYKRPSHWENRFYDEVNKKGLAGREEVWGDYPNWIVTDMRFPNEMEAIEERGGITIRVVREHDIKVQRSGNSDDYVIEKFDKTNPKHVALKLAESSRLHPSETALDDAEFHYTIENDGTLEELIEKVKKVLLIEGIL